MEGLTEGRIVHYVLPNGSHRPAIVVNNWATQITPPCEGYVNLQVITDCGNDLYGLPETVSQEMRDEIRSGMLWVTSACYSDGKEPGTWHWIEKA